MSREPIQDGPEEGGRSSVHEHPRAPPPKRTIEPPGPVDEDFARLEARVRTKMVSGERLTSEEREFLAHLPDRETRYQ